MDLSSLPISYVMYFFSAIIVLGLWFAVSEDVCAWCGKQMDRMTEWIDAYRQRRKDRSK